MSSARRPSISASSARRPSISASSARRPSISSSSASGSALAKRRASAENSSNPAAPAAAKVAAVAAGGAQQAKKRVALGNLTNQGAAGRTTARASAAKGTNNASTCSASSVKKRSSTSVHDMGLRHSSVITSSSVNASTTTLSKAPLLHMSNVPKKAVVAGLIPCSTVILPNQSRESISSDESMSTCDSMKSPEFEYIDNAESAAVSSLERRTSYNLHITENPDKEGHMLKRDVVVPMETADSIIDVDTNHNDPQLCATLACDIYKHLRMAETKKRPSTNFMDRVQKDINPSMRSILIDWLVEVAEEYRLVPETLYLTVNYIDRYLSGNEINRQRLQLLGVACMLIASKYEEIRVPQVEEFCYITDNTYFKEEVLQMEAAVLKYLKFEMTAPTAKCFLRRFVRVAQGCDEAPLLQLEFLANYIAELSLLDYDMLCYPPSIIAAAAIFLAKFILQPTKHPWNATLHHYTLYRPSDLCECVKVLHHLFCNSPGNNLPAIREKYSQHKYKFVAKKFCPSPIPTQFFQNPSLLGL